MTSTTMLNAPDQSLRSLHRRLKSVPEDVSSHEIQTVLRRRWFGRRSSLILTICAGLAIGLALAATATAKRGFFDAQGDIPVFLLLFISSVGAIGTFRGDVRQSVETLAKELDGDECEQALNLVKISSSCRAFRDDVVSRAETIRVAHLRKMQQLAHADCTAIQTLYGSKGIPLAVSSDVNWRDMVSLLLEVRSLKLGLRSGAVQLEEVALYTAEVAARRWWSWYWAAIGIGAGIALYGLSLLPTYAGAVLVGAVVSLLVPSLSVAVQLEEVVSMLTRMTRLQAEDAASHLSHPQVSQYVRGVVESGTRLRSFHYDHVVKIVKRNNPKCRELHGIEGELA